MWRGGTENRFILSLTDAPLSTSPAAQRPMEDNTTEAWAKRSWEQFP